MRSGLVQTGAWAAATGAAVLLSWLGVNAVLSDAAFDPPRTLPLPVPSAPVAAQATRSPTVPTDGATATATPTAGPSLPAPADPTTADSTSGPAPVAQTSRDTAPTTDPPAPRPTTASPHTAAPAGIRPTPPAPSSAAPSRASTVHSYLVPGGRVALDLHPQSAELVSAAPDEGWQMQIWNGDEWMRIDFSREGSTSSIFVTWNGHAPDVQEVTQ
ncbi:hypothetical protein GCM10009665_36910 [Kitasatospora nipponensis]|uniref:Secreted protein n=1 Tax=Kitasatospora nipponensis TaxID=258049 RepID=A0ABN1WGX7_9ACTN